MGVDTCTYPQCTCHYEPDAMPVCEKEPRQTFCSVKNIRDRSYEIGAVRRGGDRYVKCYFVNGGVGCECETCGALIK